jgi:regulatory protein
MSELSETDARDRALTLGLRHLNARERTVEEVRRHLLRRDVDPAIVQDTLVRLIEDGYVDDTRFARLFVEDKRTLEEWGVARIRRGLLTRGIDRELVERTLSEQAPDEEPARALQLLRRRFPTPPADRRERERALGVLIRKGFDSEMALDALAAHARGSDRA